MTTPSDPPAPPPPPPPAAPPPPPPNDPEAHATNGAAGSNGAGPSLESDVGETDEGEPDPLPPAPPAVAELCAACMRFVASKYKVALDGTPDTLSLVDQYIREAREAFKARPESIDLVAPAVGAYLGEVMRHEFGAEWFSDGSHEAWRLYFHNVYFAFNPIGVAREAIMMEEAGGWHAHLLLDPAEREAIEQRLAAMPDVEEEEYYLPTTKFDVITVVVETLSALAEASGTSDVKFTRDDYA